MPGRLRGAVVAAVTSGSAGAAGTMPNLCAADRWLATARFPDARTAAMSSPSSDGARWPTTYTPRCTSRSRPAASQRSMRRASMPASSSCPRATVPCWRQAIRAAMST